MFALDVVVAYISYLKGGGSYSKAMGAEIHWMQKLRELTDGDKRKKEKTGLNMKIFKMKLATLPSQS